MPADELGSVWSTEPVHVPQTVRRVGKEMDRDKQKEEHDPQTPEREFDTVELTTEEEPELKPAVTVHQHTAGEAELPAGSKIDLVVR